MRSLLLWLAALEAILFATGIAIMALEAIVRRGRDKRIALVRGHLIQHAGDPDEQTLSHALTRLRPAHAGRLLAELASQLAGRDRMRVIDLARQAGVHTMADRWRRSRRWRYRLQGAQIHTALGAIDRETIQMLDDDKPLVRAEAARAIATSPQPSLCPRLASMLDDESLACRLAARDALIRSGRHAVDAVSAALSAPNASQRSTLALLEIAARQGDPRALAGLRGHIDHADSVVRAAAVAALGTFGGHVARSAVLAVAEDSDLRVRAAAIEALGRIAVTEDASLIVPALFDGSWEVREAGAVALGRLGAVGRMHLRRVARVSDGPAGDIARSVLEVHGRRQSNTLPAIEVSA